MKSMVMAYDPVTGSPYVCDPCSGQLNYDTPEQRIARGSSPEKLPYVAVPTNATPGQPRNGVCTWCGHPVFLGIDGVDFERAEHEVYEFANWAGDPWARSDEHASRYVGDGP